MFLKEFIIENGIIYYRKKPLHKQPLFWTSLVASAFALLMLIVSLSLLVYVQDETSWDSAYPDEGFVVDPDWDSYEEASIGEGVVFYNGLEVTVEAIEEDSRIRLEDSSYPVAVAVELNLENTGEEPIYISEYEFSLYGSLAGTYYSLDNRTYDVNIPEKIDGGETVHLTLFYGADAESSYSLTYDTAIWHQAISERI